MKYIKLFENFEGDDKQKELANELAAYLGVNLDTFAETSKIMAMSPEGIQRWFDAEMDKEEPNMPVIEELERLGYEFDLPKVKDLFYAAEHDKVGLAKILLDQGADKNDNDNLERTPLHKAALYDSIRVATLLLDRGADKNATDIASMTPLHYAATENSIRVASLLIEKGADVNHKDFVKETPLYKAIERNKIEMAELLIKSGTDVNVKNYKNITPLYMSIINDNEVIKNLLRSRGATE